MHALAFVSISCSRIGIFAKGMAKKRKKMEEGASKGRVKIGKQASQKSRPAKIGGRSKQRASEGTFWIVALR